MRVDDLRVVSESIPYQERKCDADLEERGEHPAFAPCFFTARGSVQPVAMSLMSRLHSCLRSSHPP
jgi:hypothetical protein